MLTSPAWLTSRSSSGARTRTADWASTWARSDRLGRRGAGAGGEARPVDRRQLGGERRAWPARRQQALARRGRRRGSLGGAASAPRDLVAALAGLAALDFGRHRQARLALAPALRPAAERRPRAHGAGTGAATARPAGAGDRAARSPRRPRRHRPAHRGCAARRRHAPSHRSGPAAPRRRRHRPPPRRPSAVRSGFPAGAPFPPGASRRPGARRP